MFPVKYKLRLRRGVETVNDDGDPDYILGPAEIVPVLAWWLTGGVEPGTDGHVHRVDYDAVAFVPSSVRVRPEDEMEVPRVGWCRVDGPVSNWDNGPWWDVGFDQVRLERVSHEDSA